MTAKAILKILLAMLQRASLALRLRCLNSGSSPLKYLLGLIEARATQRFRFADLNPAANYHFEVSQP